MVGAHLDSVVEGPGINDNGSGIGDDPGDRRADGRAGIHRGRGSKVRFAFWGAEEVGLLGSEHYVNNLTDDAAGRRSTPT